MQANRLSEDDRRILAGRLLSLFSQDELSRIFESTTGERPTEKTPPHAISGRLLGLEVQSRIFEDPIFLKLLSEKLQTVSGLVLKLSSSLPKKQLEEAAKKFGVSLKPKESSTSISEALVGNLRMPGLIADVIMPSVDSLKQQAQKESSKTARSSRSDAAIQRVDETTTSMFHALENIRTQLSEVESGLREVRRESQFPALPDIGQYLKALRNETINTGQSIDSSDSVKIFDRVGRTLGIDKKTMYYLSLSYVASQYSLESLRNLKWKPTSEEFYQAISKVFASVRIIGDRAEIPSLRDATCSYLGIDKETFDDLLSRAWKERKVSLETGAPVGQYNVEYLEIDGRKFYYVKLNR
jgi:hypothetical protein